MFLFLFYRGRGVAPVDYFLRDYSVDYIFDQLNNHEAFNQFFLYINKWINYLSPILYLIIKHSRVSRSVIAPFFQFKQVLPKIIKVPVDITRIGTVACVLNYRPWPLYTLLKG